MSCFFINYMNLKMMSNIKQLYQDQQDEDEYVILNTSNDILDEKIFDIFIDEMNDKHFYNFVKKRLNQNLTQNQKKKQTKKLKKLHDNHKKTKKK